MLDAAKSSKNAGAQSRDLSARELHVLEIASLGLTNRQIAAELDLTVHTVKFHLASIYRKLGAANRTDAIVRHLRGIESSARAGDRPAETHGEPRSIGA